MKYPTLSEIETADYEQICRWYRFLPSPSSSDEKMILDQIILRYKEGGGFTTEISKKVGWDERD